MSLTQFERRIERDRKKSWAYYHNHDGEKKLCKRFPHCHQEDCGFRHYDLASPSSVKREHERLNIEIYKSEKKLNDIIRQREKEETQRQTELQTFKREREQIANEIKQEQRKTVLIELKKEFDTAERLKEKYGDMIQEQTEYETHFAIQIMEFEAQRGLMREEERRKAYIQITSKLKKKIEEAEDRVKETNEQIDMKTKYYKKMEEKILKRMDELKEKTESLKDEFRDKTLSMFRQITEFCSDRDVQKISETIDKDKCLACYEKRVERVYVPCGHMCLCDECAERQGDICPLCRESGYTLHVYFSGKV